MSHSLSLRAANQVRRGALNPVQRDALTTLVLALATAIVNGELLPYPITSVREGCVTLTYTEPPTPFHPQGWTCPPMHCADWVAAEARRDGITALAGADARARRRWTIRPCCCGSDR